MAQPHDPFTEIRPARSSAVPGDRVAVFLRLRAVVRVTGLSRATLYRLIANEQFPRPVQLGPRAVGWRLADVEAWAEVRPIATH
jgi:prophage regulatory protein